MNNNSKALTYALIGLGIIVAGVVLQKLLSIIGIILLVVAGYFLIKKKR
jgi:LPXTG-motif cell wall-anchored protein